MSKYVATQILRIGEGHVMPGEPLPDDIEPSRLGSLLRLGQCKLAEGEAPAPTPDPEPVEDDDEEAEALEYDPDDEYFPVKTGGGWFALSDGSKVQGWDEAVARQRELDEE